MKKLSTILVFFLLFQGISIHSQTRTISGKVVSFKGFPINGAVIKSKKTDKSALTNDQGNFTITCNKKDALNIAAAGFFDQTFKIKTNDSIVANLIYMNTPIAYEDVVTNLHLRKETLDHCIANLLVDNNNYDKMNSIFELIQSVYPGAKFSRDENQSSEQVLLESRGPNTVKASPYALLVVDGVPVDDISAIRPAEVKSIKVLVGNQAGHWGVRGGNGAVEIILKKGGL